MLSGMAVSSKKKLENFSGFLVCSFLIPTLPIPVKLIYHQPLVSKYIWGLNATLDLEGLNASLNLEGLYTGKIGVTVVIDYILSVFENSFKHNAFKA